ncbi:MAG: hypothetical protein AB8D78_12205, partial [Akkermansiaceae bacterium]
MISIIFLGFIVSCEKPISLPNQVTPKEDRATLAAAQLEHAKTHLGNERHSQALAYLCASLENAPSQQAQELFDSTLGQSHFEIPTIRLTHPHPILSAIRNGNSLFAAVGGPYPTVLRWNLTENPFVSSILFPIESRTISHMVVSPSGDFILIQRDSTNLLCDAESLKPITSIGTFPPHLHPKALQVFSDNSLLLAHPVASANQTLTWSIRDAATGETLRSESIPAFPKPIIASFNGTTLHVGLENETQIIIPLTGEIKREQFTSPLPSKNSYDTTTFDHDTITLSQTIPKEAILTTPISAITGFQMDSKTQSLTRIPVTERLQILSSFSDQVPKTLNIFSSQEALLNRYAAAFPEHFPKRNAALLAHTQIVRETFASANKPFILAAIKALPKKGLPTATAFLLAHQSGDSEFIDAVAQQCEDLPKALHQLNHPSANVPNLADLRKTQDWTGYESPDFSPLFEAANQNKSEIVSQLLLSDTPTEEEIRIFVEKLLNPKAIESLGAKAVAAAAIQAASQLANDQQHATYAIALAKVAQRMGASLTETLRVQATSFTSLGDFT